MPILFVVVTLGAMLAGCSDHEGAPRPSSEEGPGNPADEWYEARSPEPTPIETHNAEPASETPLDDSALWDAPYASELEDEVAQENAPADTLALAEALRMVLASASTPLDLHLELGQVYLKSRQFDRAVTEFAAALELDPRNKTAQNGIARGYARLKDDDRAERELAALVKRHPDSVRLRLEYGKVLRRQGKLDEAVKVLEAAQKMEGAGPEVAIEYHVTEGRRLRQGGNLSGARDAFAAAVAIDPTHKTAAFEHAVTDARIRTLQGDFAAAVEAAKRAVDLRPDAENALFLYHNAKGQLFRQRKQYEDAIAEFHKCVDLRPQSAGVHVTLGRTYALAHSPDDAVAYLRRAVELDPDNLNAHYHLARAYEALDWIALAKEEWKEVQRLDTQGKHLEEAKLHVHLLERIEEMTGSPAEGGAVEGAATPAAQGEDGRAPATEGDRSGV